MLDVRALGADFTGSAGSEDDAAFDVREPREERLRDHCASSSCTKSPTSCRPAEAGVGDEDDPFRRQTLEDDFDLAHGQAGRVEVISVRIIYHEVLFQAIVIRAGGISFWGTVAGEINEHRIAGTRLALELGAQRAPHIH